MGKARTSMAQQLGLGDIIDAVDEVIDITGATATTVKLSKLSKIISSVSVLDNDGAANGPRIIGEAASTASATVVKVHDDNMTLEFEDKVKKVRVKYLPIPVSE